jgi:hypothetical protein
METKVILEQELERSLFSYREKVNYTYMLWELSRSSEIREKWIRTKWKITILLQREVLFVCGHAEKRVSVFYRQAHLGIPLRWWVVVGVSPRSETRRCKENKV